VLEKNILHKILGSKTKEMTVHCKKLRKDDRHILNISQYYLGDHVENERPGHAVRVREIS
jgi:hypothetical protein